MNFTESKTDGIIFPSYLEREEVVVANHLAVGFNRVSHEKRIIYFDLKEKLPGFAVGFRHLIQLTFVGSNSLMKTRLFLHVNVT